MRCTRAQQQITAAIDGELSLTRRRALDRHLAGCADCRGELALAERTLAAVAALPMVSVPTRLEQDVLRRVRVLAADEAERRAGAGRGWFRLPAFGVAGLAVAALALGVLRVAPERPGGPGAAPVSAPHPARAPAAPATREVAAIPRSEPEPTQVARPIEPPPELAAMPDLFVELPILRNLEKLRNYDAIHTTDVDGRTVPAPATGPTSG